MKISKNNKVLQFIQKFPKTHLRTQSQRGWFVSATIIALAFVALAIAMPLLALFTLLIMIPVALIVGVVVWLSKWIENGDYS